MAKWMEYKSALRASNSYESSSSQARWSTQSNCSNRGSAKKDKGEDVKKMRIRMEQSLWSLLDDFNPDASVRTTHDTVRQVMKLVDKYCRFKSHPSKSSHSTKSSTSKPMSSPKPLGILKLINTTKSSGTAKSYSATKSSKDVHAKPFIIPRSFNFSKSPDVAKPSKAVQKSSKVSKTSKPENSLAVVKPKPSYTLVREDSGSSIDKSVEEARNELKRLADSDGFVTLFPAQYKRVPKPVQRFEIDAYEEKREKKPRRCNRRHQSNETNESAETPKKKPTVNQNKTVYAVQQQRTFSQTTSTIGSYHMYDVSF